MAKDKRLSAFENWNFKDIQRYLGVYPIERSPALLEWVTVTDETMSPIPPQWEHLVEFCRKKLASHYPLWNEYELSINFIGPFLLTIEFGNQDYDFFANRHLSAKLPSKAHGHQPGETIAVHGMVDGMVAMGDFEPEKPYFFMHEYKRLQKGEADPLGQVLIAMLAAREHNQNDNSIYGSFMVGCIWRFVLLEGGNYSQSQGFDLTDPKELKMVWTILRRTKAYIETSVAKDMKKEL